MDRIRLALVALAGTMVLACACSPDGGRGTLPRGPEVTGIEAARADYTRVTNKQAAAQIAALGPDGVLSATTLGPVCTAFAVSGAAYASDLEAIAWPDEAEAAGAALITAVGAEVTAYELCGTGSSDDPAAMFAVIDSLRSRSTSARAEASQALGITTSS